MSHGPGVHVIEMATPFDGGVQVDPSGGAILGRTVASLGVTVHCGKVTSAILRDNQSRACGVQFKDGSELACDMVVISAGIRPNLELARLDAGIVCEKAIVVNDQMLTSDPDIYAVGECAQHRGKFYGLVAPIWDQCTALADHITGLRPDAAYTGSFVATKLKVMGVNVASMGERDAQPADEVVRYEEPDGGIYKS